MTLKTLPHQMNWPGFMWDMIAAPTFVAFQTLDAAGEYVACVFEAKQSMAISHVGWRTATVTGSPTADTRIETVATDGTNSGNLWAANTNIVSGTLSSNTWTLHALTATANISPGQFFAVVVMYNSGTTIQWATARRLNGAVNYNPYLVTNVSGAAVKSTGTEPHCLALGSSTTSFYSVHGVYPISAITTVNFNNTNSAAQGLRFQVPFKCRCIGFRDVTSASVGDFNVVLYNDDGTELSSSSTAIDGDYTGSTTHCRDMYFDNPVTLSPSTWYRVAKEPTSATNTTIYTYTMPSTSYVGGCPFGAFGHYTTRASGTWTDTATDQFPCMEIIIDQLDDGKSPRSNYILGLT